MATLTQDDLVKVRAWIEQKTALIGACPICNHREWIVADSLAQALRYGPNDAVTFNPTFPFVMLFCNHCGNTQFISATMVGLAPKAPS